MSYCVAAKGGGKHLDLDQIPASRLTTRLELLRKTLRPTPHVQLAMKGMDLFAKLSEWETVQACRELLTSHGLFVGGSSGTVFAAIKRYAAKMPAYKHPTVLFLCADGGTPYLDTVFDPMWAARLE